MPKRNRSTDQPPLSQYWTPPATTGEGGCGNPWACLATTFEFDAAFFETELLPRFLGLKFDHTENEATFLVEREEALAFARVAVLVDQSRFDSAQTTLRWDQFPIYIPGGIQHAKITVLAWEKLIRVIIGSANLTRAAYRKNREIIAALDFWNSPDSPPLRMLRDTLDALLMMLVWSRSSAEAAQRTRDTVERLRRMIRGWSESPADFTPRERPRVTLAVTHPRADGQPARSTLGEISTMWGNRRASAVTVVSPFAGSDPDPKVGDQVVNRLTELPMTRDCEGWLVLPELPRTPEDQRTRLPFPQVFKDTWAKVFAGRGGAYVLPIPPCVEGREDRNRNLHSKILTLESEHDNFTMMMIGSSNFTPRGMGVGSYNFEANLVFEDEGSAKRGGICLTDRFGLPRTWDEALALDAVEWQTPEERSEDEPDPKPILPAFFAWATYSQTTRELKLGLNRKQNEPQEWSVRLPGAGVDAPTLFAKQPEPAEPGSLYLVRVLPDSMRAANIVALLVEWKTPLGELQQAKLAVSIEGEEHLLPPEQFLKLDADTIIECLVSGKSPPQWFDQINGKRKSAKSTDAAIESLRAVDTTEFLLYRVRRFGRALTAMSQRILGTILHPDAIRYRLLKDPFGPISLAQSLFVQPESHQKSWCARLDGEHRLFLLAEILLTVIHLQPRIARGARGKDKEVIQSVFAAAIQQLQQLADSIATDAQLPQNLRAYVAHVQSLCSQQEGSVTEVLSVD